MGEIGWMERGRGTHTGPAERGLAAVEVERAMAHLDVVLRWLQRVAHVFTGGVAREQAVAATATAGRARARVCLWLHIQGFASTCRQREHTPMRMVKLLQEEFSKQNSNY